jgi:hypothetical protein
MKKVRVSLRPIVNNISLPTVLKTATLPGEQTERLFFATQPGVIYYMGDNGAEVFLDIRSRVLRLGGYDERGLLGMAFHPRFNSNGLFYLHYSVAGTQGRGALSEDIIPSPCELQTLNLVWRNRETRFDHIDTVEEWSMQNGQPGKLRTLLNLRRPFMNHNGVNSLNFSPESGRLVLTTGDGGSGFDPFNLSQNDMETAGKIIEINVNSINSIEDQPAVTRFDELAAPVREMLTLIAKGVRNMPGICYQRMNNQYLKYAGNVGQELVESIFTFVNYKPIPVSRLVTAIPDPIGFINFGWRGWEGDFPTCVVRNCPNNAVLNEKTVAYFEEAALTSTLRLQPLISYYHRDPRPDRAGATALTGITAYMGRAIPDLTGCVLFTDLAAERNSQPARGFMAYTTPRQDCKLNDLSVIEIDFDFGQQPAYFVSLGSNTDQTRLFLGVYTSMRVADLNRGSIFEIIP